MVTTGEPFANILVVKRVKTQDIFRVFSEALSLWIGMWIHVFYKYSWDPGMLKSQILTQQAFVIQTQGEDLNDLI